MIDRHFEHYYVNEKTIYVHDKPKNHDGKRKKGTHKIELLFGDGVEIDTKELVEDEYKVHIDTLLEDEYTTETKKQAKEAKKREAYMSRKYRDDSITSSGKDRPLGEVIPLVTSPTPKLEIYFIDVGQGDAIFIHTPTNKGILIDGGPDNTAHKFLTKIYNLDSGNFLSKLFKLKKGRLVLDYVIMTHADDDHAKGLIEVFNNDKIIIKHIYHNGIAKFDGEKDKIGRRTPDGKLLTELFDDIDDFKLFDDIDDCHIVSKAVRKFKIRKFRLAKTNHILSRNFCNWVDAIKKAKERNRDLMIKRVDNKTDPDKIFNDLSRDEPDLNIEILGPINEGDSDNPKYRYFSNNDDAMTINGNSLSLRLTYGKCTTILCGDMNDISEKYLLAYCNEKKIDLHAHIFKANHHGSHKFSVEFLKSIKPGISVVSSGIPSGTDYGHPRAVLMACLGKYSNQNIERPVLFSTKLSVGYAKFNTVKKFFNFKNIKDFFKTLSNYLRKSEDQIKEDIPKMYKKLHDGTIYVRTDGETVVAARLYGKKAKKWEAYKFYVDKHGTMVNA